LAVVGVLAVLDPPHAARSADTTYRIAIPIRDTETREDVNRVLTPPTLPNRRSVVAPSCSPIAAPNRTRPRSLLGRDDHRGKKLVRPDNYGNMGKRRPDLR
jgi:hypothetical protein